MPSSTTIVVRGGTELKVRLKQDADLIAAYGSKIVTEEAKNLRSLIQRFADTGRHPPGAPHIPGTGPGPNRATGDYIKSWRYRSGTSAYAIANAAVYTDAPQANRLEYGFWKMSDSLGRTFRQPAYPHVQPAVDVVEPRLHARIEAMVAAVIAGVPFGGGGL